MDHNSPASKTRLPYADDEDRDLTPEPMRTPPAPRQDKKLRDGDLPEWRTPRLNITPPACAACQDLGHIDVQGIRQRCSCRYGVELPESVLAMFNDDYQHRAKRMRELDPGSGHAA